MDSDADVVGLVHRLAQDPNTIQVLVFKGYCAWGQAQLQVCSPPHALGNVVSLCRNPSHHLTDKARGQGELARGMWGWAPGRVADLTYDAYDGHLGGERHEEAMAAGAGQGMAGGQVEEDGQGVAGSAGGEQSRERQRQVPNALSRFFQAVGHRHGTVWGRGVCGRGGREYSDGMGWYGNVGRMRDIIE